MSFVRTYYAKTPYYLQRIDIFHILQQLSTIGTNALLSKIFGYYIIKKGFNLNKFVKTAKPIPNFTSYLFSKRRAC